MPRAERKSPSKVAGSAQPSDPKKERIKEELRTRVRFLSNDCRTFWRVRLERSVWHKKNDANNTRPIGLGGGNFVMALAMLSACNLLAKGYAWLKKPEMFATQVDIETVKTAIREAKKITGVKVVLEGNNTKWKAPILGECNETEAFKLLIEALLADGIDLGVPVTEAKNVWRDFRNKLAHMAAPEGIVGVYGDQPKPLTKAGAEAFIRGKHKAFLKEGDAWMCIADRLSLDVLDICEWLCQKIDEHPIDQSVESMGLWLLDKNWEVSEPPSK